jgi:hypothetical protein
MQMTWSPTSSRVWNTFEFDPVVPIAVMTCSGEIEIEVEPEHEPLLFESSSEEEEEELYSLAIAERTAKLPCCMSSLSLSERMTPNASSVLSGSEDSATRSSMDKYGVALPARTCLALCPWATTY